jgi:chromosome partitioning protein
MGAVARREIPYGFLWSLVPTAIRSREAAALEQQVEQGGILVIGRVFDRTAFKSLFSFATTLDELPRSEVPGIDKAKADAVRLTEAVAELLGNQASKVTEAA